MDAALDITRLKEQIARIEGRTKRFTSLSESPEKTWSFGLPAMDGNLPGEGLAIGALHDAFPEQNVNIAAVSSFLLRLLTRLPRAGPIVWCQSPFEMREHGRVHVAGLAAGALGPERIVSVSLPHAKHMGFVLEQALAMTPVAAVVGEGSPLAFTETRRLALIAARSGVPCIYLNADATAGTSAALTRWRVKPLPGPPDPIDPRAPGPPAWGVELTRVRGGRPGCWEITWNDETHSFRSLSDACDRPLAAAGGGAAALFSARSRRRTG